MEVQQEVRKQQIQNVGSSNSQSYSTLRIISRVAILLVVMGFFMPMGCDQTGFELAERLGKATNDTSFGIALYGLFISALIGGGLLIPLVMKKKVHIAFDWIFLVVSFVFAIFVYSKIKDYFQAYGEMGGQTLQIGSWFVIIGLIGSTLALIFSPLMENMTPPIVEYSVDNGGITITKYKGEIRNIVIPESINDLPVVSIGIYAFGGNRLTNIVIPNSVKSIGESAFYGNRLTSVVIPNSVESIGDLAFGDNRLTSVVIPNSVKSIGNMAFQANDLTNIVIPNSVKSIGNRVFQANNLKSVAIPNFTTIGEKAFDDNVEIIRK